jgi:hypothetical protein
MEHDGDETPEKLAADIERQLMRVYGVTAVELSSFTTLED